MISIGNLTVGGTGKTPIVEKFALGAANRRPSRRHPEPRLQKRAETGQTKMA